MEGRKFSLKNLMGNAISSTNGKCRKMFAVSIMQYMAFLITYLLTQSFLISFVVYSIFLPSAIKFYLNMEDGKAESVFKIGKSFTTAVLISLLFVFTFGMGLILLIFPGIIVFANYVLVFDEAKDGSKDAIQAFRDAKKSAKGYRGRIALLSLAFLLILILLVGFGILISWAFSLFIPALNYSSSFLWSFLILPLFYYVGVFIGVSVFMILVLPVEVIAISKIREEIAQDKIYLEAEEARKAEETRKAEEEAKKQEEALAKESVKESDEKAEDVEESKKEVPSDYIS